MDTLRVTRVQIAVPANTAHQVAPVECVRSLKNDKTIYTNRHEHHRDALLLQKREQDVLEMLLMGLIAGSMLSRLLTSDNRLDINP